MRLRLKIDLQKHILHYSKIGVEFPFNKSLCHTTLKKVEKLRNKLDVCVFFFSAINAVLKLYFYFYLCMLHVIFKFLYFIYMYIINIYPILLMHDPRCLILVFHSINMRFGIQIIEMDYMFYIFLLCKSYF